jgi:hypothetical protein
MPNLRLPLSQREVLDEYFVENRTRLLEVAAFLDRLDRAAGPSDFRRRAFEEALRTLVSSETRVEALQALLSDPTAGPLPALDRKSALGAYDRWNQEAHS